MKKIRIVFSLIIITNLLFVGFDSHGWTDDGKWYQLDRIDKYLSNLSSRLKKVKISYFTQCQEHPGGGN